MARLPDENVISEAYDPSKDYGDPLPNEESEYRKKKAQESGAGGGTTTRSTTGQRTDPVVGSSRLASETKQAGDANIEAFLTKALPSKSGTKIELIVSDFRYGLITSLKRGTRPIGSLADMQNFLINKVNGALVQRHGFSSVITEVIDGDGTSWSTEYFKEISVDTPSETTMYIAAALSGSDRRWLQKPFFQSSATATNTWVELSEKRTLVTASNPDGAGTTVTIANGPTDSASTADDYYNGWVIFNDDVADPSTQGYLLVTDYDGSGKVITTSDIIPAAWGSGESIILYRFFHDNPGFTPTHAANSSLPPVLQLGDNWVASGGRNSAVGYKPIWSGYLNKQFFFGATPFTYHGTYVTEAEIKSTSGYISGVVAAGAGTSQLDITKKWFLAFVLETDDGQFSQPDFAGGDTLVDGGGEEAITCRIDIEAARINKRLRYVNVFMGYTEDLTSTEINWEDYFYITRYDMLTDDFTYQATVGTQTGYHYVSVALDNINWDLRQENLLEFLGVDGPYTGSTVSFNYATIVAGRLFVADFYDYTDSKTYRDQVRFTGFGNNSIPQLNVLPNIPEFNQTTVGGGDASNVQNIVNYQGNLFILKDNSCYVIPITDDATTWTLNKIANIGTDVPYSVTPTPYGVCWANSGDDMYIWNGGYPRSLTNNTIKETFLAFSTTYKANWRGFFDPITVSYNLFYDTGTATDYIYSTHFDIPVLGNYAWTKHSITLGPTFFNNSPLGNPTFGGGTSAVFKFSLTADDDAGTDIAPFFDTGEYVLDERNLTALQDWYMSLGNNTVGTWAQNLDVQILIDGSSVGSYTSIDQDKASGFYKALLPITAIGRRVQFKFNSNATKSTYDRGAGDGLTIYEVGFSGEVRKLLGDASHSL